MRGGIEVRSVRPDSLTLFPKRSVQVARNDVTVAWTLLIWEEERLGDGSPVTQGSQGWFVPAQRLASGAAGLGGQRTHVGSICSGLLRLSSCISLSPGAVGRVPATWSGNQVRVRYRHQDPESTGQVYLRRLRDTECLRGKVGPPQECFVFRCTQPLPLILKR